MPPTGRRPNGQHGGRIRVHQRRTDDATPLIGGVIALQVHHTTVITTTWDKYMTDKCRKDYRNRIKRFIEWFKVSYPSYYDEGTRDLSPEELADPSNVYHTNT